MIKQTRISDTCQLFAEETGIKVTPNAQELIGLVLNGIIDDPHPNWHTNKSDNEKVADKFAYDLPQMLHDVMHSENVTHEITTFDMLHWLTLRLPSLCPFAK